MLDQRRLSVIHDYRLGWKPGSIRAVDDEARSTHII
jgi:hypothetical protein